MRLLGRKRVFIITGLALISGLFAFENYQIMTDREDVLLDHLELMDCGVVLTGGPGRIREALEVLAQKKIKKLVISGVYKDTQLIEIFPSLPFYPEINPNDIVLEKRSESTFGNAVQSLAVVQSLQCRNVLLITSQMHMHRAFKIFKTIYPEHIQIKKYPVYHLKKERNEIDLIIETFKSVFYIVFGRVL